MELMRILCTSWICENSDFAVYLFGGIGIILGVIGIVDLIDSTWFQNRINNEDDEDNDENWFVCD